MANPQAGIDDTFRALRCRRLQLQIVEAERAGDEVLLTRLVTEKTAFVRFWYARQIEANRFVYGEISA